MRIVWKYTWVKIYVLLTIIAVVKQFYSFAVLVDYFEYKKTAIYLFQNWTSENAPIERFLEPMRRTILFPIIWRISDFNWPVILIVQFVLSLTIPLALFRLVNHFKFHSKFFPLSMMCLITYPLQFFYTGFIMPDIWSQVLLLWMVVFYVEEKYKFIPLFLILLSLLKPVFVVFLIFPFVLAILKKYTISFFDFIPICIALCCCYFNYQSYNVFTYSSITTTNPYDYNRKILLNFKSQNPVEVDRIYELEHQHLLSLGTDMVPQKRYMDSLTQRSINENLGSYIFLHLKGMGATFLDPGRYDAMVFLNWKKSFGMMGVNDGNSPSKIPNWQYAYMVFLALIQLIKFTFAIFAIVQLFRYFQIKFMTIIVLLLAFLAGPVGCARYMLPSYPLMAMLSALGIICFTVKFPKIESFITKR
jgi:hypothetical protein